MKCYFESASGNEFNVKEYYGILRNRGFNVQYYNVSKYEIGLCINIRSLEELMNISRVLNQDLIMSTYNPRKFRIYDDYVE